METHRFHLLKRTLSPMLLKGSDMEFSLQILRNIEDDARDCIPYIYIYIFWLKARVNRC
jgi:hypothetical protein